MSTKLYTLGRGELLFSPFAAGTQNETGFDDLGNVPEFNLSREIEMLDHFSSREGIRNKDQSVLTQNMMTGNFTADEIRRQNLAYFLGGSASLQTVSSGTAVVTLIPDATPGRRYQLGATTANPMGVRDVSNVVVTNTTTSATISATNNYTVDAASGMITVLEGSADITGSVGITVTFNHAAFTRQLVVTSDMEIQGALKFISKAPVGMRVDWYLPWVKLTPNGDMQVISDEWSTIPFNIEVLKKAGLATAYAGGIPVVT
jgi:hypothetical protein